jgi:hypothetical protein
MVKLLAGRASPLRLCGADRKCCEDPYPDSRASKGVGQKEQGRSHQRNGQSLRVNKVRIYQDKDFEL